MDHEHAGRRRARAPGRTLPAKLGRYTLFAHIGRGGMADIYLASAETDLGARRLVVLKELLPELAHDAAFAAMLVAEAKLAARLDHANVAKVEDLGRDGTLFIAMEYVEGVDLREMLRHAAKAKLPVPVDFSLRIVVEALKGLGFAHRFRDERGARLPVVHRDVSPSNVLLSFEGEVKLCDFGIARANPLAGAAPVEAIQGKAGYMSPEQASGAAVDARSDVFAAGIVLWELLGGRRLHKARDGVTLLEVARRAEVPALPRRGLPDEDALHAIVARALERDPDARYASADAMRADLEEYAAAAGLVASPLRFGVWLAEHFGEAVLGPRRAGERAVLAAREAGAADALEATTPSSFMVLPRAPDPLATVPSPATPASPGPANAPRDRRGAWFLAAAAALLVLVGTAWQALVAR